MMKRFGKMAGLFLAFVIIGMAGLVTAAQLSSATWYRAGSQYGRSDGVFQHRETNILSAFINGQYLGTVGNKGFYEDFSLYGDGDDLIWQVDYTVADCGDTDENFIYFPSGNTFRLLPFGDSTACIDMDAGSLDISGDDTNNEGFELFAGVQGATGGHFVVGDDPAFFTCASVTIADAGATDDFHIGFRNAAEVANATFDSHTHFATIGVITDNIVIETAAAGATTTTDTTQNATDATEYEYCVYVSAAGVTTYTIDDVAPATTAAYTFADATSVIPFIWYLNDTGTTGEVDVTKWEAGYQ